MSKTKADNAITFARTDTRQGGEPFHYTVCGLNDIYLLNGFSRRETSYDTGVAVDNVDALHRAIGHSIIRKWVRLTGSELRFLRMNLRLTQAELAQRLDTDIQNIGRYEREETSIPGPVDKLMRAVYIVSTCSDEEFVDLRSKLCALMGQLPASETGTPRQVFEKRKDTWRERQIAMA